VSLISLINFIPLGNPAERGFWLYKNISPALLRKLEADNFRKTTSYVYQHSKFYKRKFDERQIRPEKVKRPEDLGDFFTSAEDIRQNVQEFVCAKPDTAYETTGTTSKQPKRVYFSRNEIKEAGWAGAVGLWGVGVRPQDRVASAFDTSFWVSGPVLQASCETIGCFHVEAGRINPEEFYERLKDYGITVIVGDPSWLLGLTEIAERKGLRHNEGGQAWPLKLLIGGGENVTESMRQHVESVWKADFLLSYGQTEAFGAIGMESRDKDGYQLNEFHNFFEIINPDKDGYGELVYTTLNRRVMPLVRYRSGDITKFLEPHPPKSAADRNSPHGLPGRRIAKLKGRVDEWTATAMGNLAPWMFEAIFGALNIGAHGRAPVLGEDWQIVIQKEGDKDRIELHVEGMNGEGAGETDVREKVFRQIEFQLTDAWKSYQLGLFKMDLKLHPAGTLRQGRKLVRLIDKRKF